MARKQMVLLSMLLSLASIVATVRDAPAAQSEVIITHASMSTTAIPL